MTENRLESCETTKGPGTPNTKSWLISVFFLAFTAALLNVEFRKPKSVPLQSTNVATVPLFNAWTIGWNADRLRHGLEGYWHAPIFYPSENTFAFSEPQPATLLIAPIVWLSGSVITAYKFWLLLSFALNGIFGALLLRRLGYSSILQWVGGTAMLLLPVAWQRIDVIQLVPIWGILWFWSCLFRLEKSTTRRTVIELGVAFGTCFALCVHHSVFLSLLTPFGALVFLPRLRRPRFLAGAAGAFVVASALVLPIIVPIRNAARTNNFVRGEKLVKRLSAYPRQYLASPDRSLVRFDRFDTGKSRQFNVGWIRMSLALTGLFAGIIFGRRRRWVVFLVLTGGTAFAFSQGLNLNFNGWSPWKTLIDYVPGIGQVRSVYRFAFFVQMATILLAIEGLWAFQTLASMPSSTLKKRILWCCIVAIPGLVTAAEVWPPESERGPIPEVAQHRLWTEFIRQHSSPGRPIVCLPMATGTSVNDYDVTSRWMCYGLEHGVPMLNGYSGFFPDQYISTRDIVNEKFPSPEALRRFQAMGVEFIVVARVYCPPEIMLRMSSDELRLELVLEDPIFMDVYRIH